MRFFEDAVLEPRFRSRLDDYRNSDYDRGHLVSLQVFMLCSDQRVCTQLATLSQRTNQHYLPVAALTVYQHVLNETSTVTQLLPNYQCEGSQNGLLEDLPFHCCEGCLCARCCNMYCSMSKRNLMPVMH